MFEFILYYQLKNWADQRDNFKTVAVKEEVVYDDDKIHSLMMEKTSHPSQSMYSSFDKTRNETRQESLAIPISYEDYNY